MAKTRTSAAPATHPRPPVSQARKLAVALRGEPAGTEIEFCEDSDPENLYGLHVSTRHPGLLARLARLFGCPEDELPYDREPGFHAGDDWHGAGQVDLRALFDELNLLNDRFFPTAITVADLASTAREIEKIQRKMIASRFYALDLKGVDGGPFATRAKAIAWFKRSAPLGGGAGQDPLFVIEISPGGELLNRLTFSRDELRDGMTPAGREGGRRRRRRKDFRGHPRHDKMAASSKAATSASARSDPR